MGILRKILVRRGVRKDMRQLKEAKDNAERRGNAILAGILGELNKADPGWTLQLTGQDEVIFFINGPDCISLNLETGELDAVSVLTDVGRRGLAILSDEVDRKMDSWLKVANDFESKRVLLLERTRSRGRTVGISDALEG